MSPNFCMVVLRFIEPPESATEAEDPIEELVTTINVSAHRTGVYAMCVSVAGWGAGEVLATFLVIDKSGDDTRINNTFRHSLTKLDLDSMLSIVDREDRVENVQCD